MMCRPRRRSRLSQRLRKGPSGRPRSIPRLIATYTTDLAPDRKMPCNCLFPDPVRVTVTSCTFCVTFTKRPPSHSARGGIATGFYACVGSGGETLDRIRRETDASSFGVGSRFVGIGKVGGQFVAERVHAPKLASWILEVLAVVEQMAARDEQGLATVRLENR